MNVLVTGCGSSIGFEIAKSLRESNHRELHVIGTEISWWGEAFGRKHCDEVVRSVRCDDASYRENLLGWIDSRNITAVYVNNDGELDAIARFRDDIKVPVTCPEADSLRVCLDKMETYLHLKAHLRLPESIPATQAGDVRRALEAFGSPIWLRSATGGAGKGSILIKKAEQALNWISYWEDLDSDITDWVAHEYLPGRNYCWCSVWRDGELIASAAGERLRYMFANVAVSGVTGVIGEGQTVKGGKMNELGELAVRAVSPNATGVFSVDFKEDRNGHPILTEINPRPAFRPWLFLEAGFNVAEVFHDAVVLGREVDKPRFDAAELGVRMARIVDSEPVFTRPASG